MSTDRLREKSELHFKLGKLFGPLQELDEYPDQYDEQDRAETLARYFAEYSKLIDAFRAFSTGQPGHDYGMQYSEFFSALDALGTQLRGRSTISEVVQERKAIAQAAIDAIPIPRTSIILEAGSPFTAYCKIRDLCEAEASKSITWIDPYLESSLFHRYLRSVRETVSVTLVTSEPDTNAGRKNKERWSGFLDISRLYASERGPDRYRLIVHPQQHDRWLVIDDKRIYSLGGSVKDAGKKDYFTIASVASPETNHAKIHDHITTGEEWFGPTVGTHR